MVMSKSDEEALDTNLGLMFPTLMLRKSMTTGTVTHWYLFGDVCLFE